MSTKNNVTTSPIILSIETSGQCGSVALTSPGCCLAEHSLQTSVTHSRRILVTIENIFRETGIDWPKINGLAVSLGPGSFTGLRIGLSTAKGLAMAAEIPLIGIPTLDALACQLHDQQMQICALTDARKKEVYYAFYRIDKSGDLKRHCGYKALKPEKLVDLINESTIFVGDGLSTYGGLIKEKLGDLALFAPGELFFARAAAIGFLALEKWHDEDFLENAVAEPIYVRKSEAEILFSGPGKATRK